MKLVSIPKEKNKFNIPLPDKKKFNSKDILRLQSSLISGFIRGTIESSEAKTLSYLCSNYIQNLQAVETET